MSMQKLYLYYKIQAKQPNINTQKLQLTKKAKQQQLKNILKH